MKKFWVVHNIPSPYRLHIFNALWKECKARGLDFHVHFMSDMSRGYDERPVSWRNPKMDFPYTYWKDYGVGQRHINPGLLWHLRKHQPEYLLVGSPFDTLTGMLAGRMTEGVTCTWCEGNARSPGQLGGVKGLLKQIVLSSYDYVAVPGNQGKKYIDLIQARTSRKMPKCVFLPNLIDETLFHSAKQTKRSDEMKVCIIPARLSPEKGVIEFLECITPSMIDGWRIVIVGDGPLRKEVEGLIAIRGLEKSVSIHDFVSYKDMPNLYACADLMLLPSLRDQNPLAVIEALHSGLPVAESNQAGNVDEAVTVGKNGWVLPVNDKNRYEGVLKEIFSTSAERLREMGEWSLNHNARFWDTKKSIAWFADEIINRKESL